MDLALLRDRTYLTELAVLYALHEDPSVRLTGVAEQLGVTVQAVSNYAKRLVEEGLLEEDGYRVTPEGVQEIHERIEELKRTVDAAYRRLNVITETAAVAGADIEEGQPVGLVMEEGLMVAYPDRESSSTGVAASTATEGATVYVRDLEGILDIEPGTVHVVRVPTPAGAAEVQELIDRQELAWDRIGGVGTEAQVLVRDLEGSALEFAPVPAAFEAAQLGLDVLLLVVEERVRDAVSRLEGLNDDALIPVRYRLHETA